MPGQRRRVADSGRKCHCIGIFCRLDNTYYLEIFPVFHEIFHIGFIAGFVCPDTILTVVRIIVRTVDQFKGNTEKIFIRIASHIFRCFDIFFIDKLPDHLIQFHSIPKSECIKHKVTDVPVCRQDNHTLIIILRPSTGLYIVLPFIEIFIFRHFIKHVRTHHGGHHTVGPGG